MIRAVLCAAAIFSMMVAVTAFATDDAPQVELCKFIADRSVEYIRQGEMDKAWRLKPQLETCEPILRTARQKAVQELIDWSNERLKDHR
jgi:hypothetical protein